MERVQIQWIKEMTGKKGWAHIECKVKVWGLQSKRRRKWVRERCWKHLGRWERGQQVPSKDKDLTLKEHTTGFTHLLKPWPHKNTVLIFYLCIIFICFWIHFCVSVYMTVGLFLRINFTQDEVFCPPVSVEGRFRRRWNNIQKRSKLRLTGQNPLKLSISSEKENR